MTLQQGDETTLFYSDSSKTKERKKRIVKVRYYPCFMYSQLDKWLKKMSSSGWHIVHIFCFLYFFEKGLPESKEYFTYFIPIRGEGKYNLSLRYPFLEKKIAKKNSQINSNNKKWRNVIEVDFDKIDISNDVYYKELLADRNKLATIYFIRNAIIFLIIILLFVVCKIIS